MYASRRLRPAVSTLVLCVGALLTLVWLAAPASAAERMVTVSADGVAPATLEVQPGDTVSFVVASGTVEGYRLQSTSSSWPAQFDTRIGGLLGSRSFTVPQPLTKPGIYTYTAARGTAVSQGKVAVPEPPAPAEAPASPAAGAAPPSPGAAAPGAPAPTGGSGSTALPPLTGGFGPLQTGPVPGGLAPAPTLALPELPEQFAFGPQPVTAAAPDTVLTATAVPGNLAAQPTPRGYGLPTALAAVLAGGVLSLLVRLRRAEPVTARPPKRAEPGRIKGERIKPAEVEPERKLDNRIKGERVKGERVKGERVKGGRGMGGRAMGRRAKAEPTSAAD